MKIHGTAKGGALSKKDFGVAFGGAATPVEIADCTGFTSSGTSNAADSGRIRASPVTASDSFTVTKIRFYGTGTGGNVKLSIYSDDSNSPDALLATTGSKEFVSETTDYDLEASYEVSSGTKYWLSLQNDFTVTLITGTDGERAAMYTNSIAFSSTPNPYPTPINETTSGLQICMIN